MGKIRDFKKGDFVQNGNESPLLIEDVDPHAKHVVVLHLIAMQKLEYVGKQAEQFARGHRVVTVTDVRVAMRAYVSRGEIEIAGLRKRAEGLEEKLEKQKARLRRLHPHLL